MIKYSINRKLHHYDFFVTLRSLIAMKASTMASSLISKNTSRSISVTKQWFKSSSRWRAASGGPRAFRGVDRRLPNGANSRAGRTAVGTAGVPGSWPAAGREPRVEAGRRRPGARRRLGRWGKMSTSAP